MSFFCVQPLFCNKEMKKFTSGFIEYMCPEIHESAVKSMLASSCVLEAA